MKTLLLFSSLFLSLSFIPFAISGEFPTYSPVVDGDGVELKVGTPYYILSPRALVFQQGLCLNDVRNESTPCPHDVVQCPLFSPSSIGFPVIFSSDSDDTVVKENTPYSVKFTEMENCTEETVWTLTDADESSRKFVATDPDVPAVTFQLQQSGDGYRIISCEIIENPQTAVCYTIGFVWESGYNRLAIGSGVDEIQFVFRSTEESINIKKVAMT